MQCVQPPVPIPVRHRYRSTGLVQLLVFMLHPTYRYCTATPFNPFNATFCTSDRDIYSGTGTGNEIGDTAYRHWTGLMVWNFTVLPEPLSCATVPPAISSRYIEIQCLCPCQPAHASIPPHLAPSPSLRRNQGFPRLQHVGL